MEQKSPAATSTPPLARAGPFDKVTVIRKDEKAIQSEQQNQIRFQPVINDGSRDNMILLTGLKNLFQKQLPNMPKEYITRLVYDKFHRCLAIVKPPNLTIVGGISYKLFPKQQFCEIVFCAITSNEQVKGYGSYMMNKLKEHVKTEAPIKYFLTYADNYATGYFRKQGFTDEITLDRSIWQGYIKDYDGGTLMQCSMVDKVDYLKIPEIILAQKQALFDSYQSICHKIYPGLKYNCSIADIPGVLLAGWNEEMSRLTNKKGKSPLYEFLRPFLSEMQNHPSAWPFLEPVNGDEVVDYYDVIKEPMDLKTMEERLEDERYSSVEEFANDMRKIFKNCKSYNHDQTQYYKCADKLELFFEQRLVQRMEESTTPYPSPLVLKS